MRGEAVMKKVIFLIITLALCLSLLGCASPNTFEAAVKMSEKRINEEAKDAFDFSYTYPDSQEAFTIIMKVLPEADPHAYTAEGAKAAAKGIFKDISWYFSSLDTAVVVAVMFPEGELLHTFTDKDF